MQAQFQVDKMSCASCAGRVERALLAVPGVVEASVNLTTQTANARWEGGGRAVDLAQAISDAGYPASTLEDDSEIDAAAAQKADAQELKRLMTISAILTFPVFAMEMLGHAVPAIREAVEAGLGQRNAWTIQFVLVTLVMVWPGQQFLTRGFPALLKGRPDMNALVALGTTAAWAYSTLSLFAPSVLGDGNVAVYFEAAAVIVTLILLGRFLEARAKGRTGDAIQALMALQPSHARVMRDGEWQDVERTSVVAGDLLQLRPGERIAVDGEVAEGSSYIDESMLTGEAHPVAKSIGASLVGGTVNGGGALTYRATAVGSDTVLAGILRMVSDAQGNKLPIQSLVDRVIAWFVPAVLVIAALTVLVWLIFGANLSFALVTGVSVLIIACPCALGLATPTAVMVGTGRAAEAGVLFRKGSALQRLADVSAVVFDKTGTLTEGRPELIEITPLADVVADDVLRLAAAVESRSEHPISKAVYAAAESPVPDVQEFEAHIGQGVSGVVDGQQVRVGSARFMTAEGVLMDGAPVVEMAGRTRIFVALDGVLSASLTIADPLKPSAAPMVSKLSAAGIRSVILTGDSLAAAEPVQEALAISELLAEVMPNEKADRITALRGEGITAFVGDGINDGPALATADVGLAIGTGTDVAIEAADVVLVSGDLGGVSRAMELSRATMRTIRQNLFWAFAYNVALIPVAAGVLYPLTGMLLSPMLAAGAMALSSVFVVSNALRLKRA